MMAPHDRGHDREAKAGAALAAGTTGITAEEAIEDALLIGRSDADPTVLHLQQPNVSLAPQPQPSWCLSPWALCPGAVGFALAVGCWWWWRRRRRQSVAMRTLRFRRPPCLLGQNAFMTAAPSTTTSTPIDPRISAIASGIAAAIPQAQVRLFGSRARGTSRPDSDVDLLITVPDQWLAGHDRVRVLGELWRQYSSHRLPLDLLLYTETEVSQRQQYRSAVTSLAYQEGILLNG